MKSKRIGIYPGTFDPITNGHSDIIRRARKLVDHLIVAVAVNTGKGPMFSLEERLSMVHDETQHLNGDGRCSIDVVPFDSLLMSFATERNATMIVRGLRALSDFDYEFQMTGMNARLNPEIETVFLMASERQQFVSSRFVKEISRLGGEIGSFVSERVQGRLLRKVAEERAAGSHKAFIGAQG